MCRLARAARIFSAVLRDTEGPRRGSIQSEVFAVRDLSHIYEKLGAFYLGKDYDLDHREMGDEPLLYDSKDLCTHAVLVGMTGSGKTGLGVTLIEEAAIDRIPSLIVDPKGDLTNLLLNFPDLDPADFEPWVQEEEARRAGMSVREFAAQRADLWRNGLADWHQSPERIRKLRDSCDFNVYTPGSTAGIPISILSSFEPPSQEIMDDPDLLGDRVSATATSLLTLLGIDADPIQSREHILLTTILNHCWQKNMKLDLGALIQMVQSPPVQKIGVMDIDSFFPSKDRFGMAMAMNNLLAAPGFQAWMTGEAMDVDRLLYTPSGKPRVSIFCISHLNDAERMFFMSLLLNQTLSWMRSRPGTNSLRALLYIDEIFGYMPPVSNPPSKKPLLTLLKQARAFGLGLVLATQNPVDLDYKGLSNTGTWFLGRLQTERDKMRVLDGLEGASAEAGGRFDRDRIGEILSGVGKRVFLMHNVHDSAPVTFHTRWALSYLSGPMTRNQIKRLMESKRGVLEAEDSFATEAPRMRSAAAESEVEMLAEANPVEEVAQRPVLPPDIREVFLPFRRPAGLSKIFYQPALLAIGKVHFTDTRKGLSAEENLAMLCELDDIGVEPDWDAAKYPLLTIRDLEKSPPEPGNFAELPAGAAKPRSYSSWEKDLADHIYRNWRFNLFKCEELKLYSDPGESEREFRIRIADIAREHRDEAVQKLRKKYATRLRNAEKAIRKAEERVDRESSQASRAKMDSYLSIGRALLGLGGRGGMLGNLSRGVSASRGWGRASEQTRDIAEAEESVREKEEKLEDLQADMENDIAEIEERFDADSIDLERLPLKPRRTDIDIQQFALAWVPVGKDRDGFRIELFDDFRRVTGADDD